MTQPLTKERGIEEFGFLTMSGAENSILQTIIYYESLGRYPLTAVEIYQYLQKDGLDDKKPSFSQIFSLLKFSPFLLRYVSQQNGFFFRKEFRQLVQQRISRQKIAIFRWKKIRKIVAYLFLAPYLDGLFVSGSLTIDNVKWSSDLDLLVITKKKRIWTARSFLMFLLQIIGQRRHDNVVKGKICLNHYVAQNHLKIQLQNLSNAQLYCQLVPLTNYPQYQNFLAQNSWISNFLFSSSSLKRHHWQRVDEKKWLYRMEKAIAGSIEFLLNNLIGDWLEKSLAAWQGNRIQQKNWPRQLGTDELYLSDETLIFHNPICKNREVMQAYNDKINCL